MILETTESAAANAAMRIVSLATAVLIAGCGGGNDDELNGSFPARASQLTEAQMSMQGDDGTTRHLDVNTEITTEEVSNDTPEAGSSGLATTLSASRRMNPTETPVIVGANTNFIKGQWLYYGGMWARFLDPRLIETTNPLLAGGATNNYYLRAVLSPSGFPNNWTQTWTTPSNYSYTRPGNPGVYGYLFAAYCNYDNGTNNPVGCLQRQVDNISNLFSEFSIKISPGGGGTLKDFNVLHEFYLTSVRGNLSTKQLEVGVFLHASDGGARFHAGGTQLGVFTDSKGISWTCARNGTFVTFLRQDGGDQLVGAFDWRGALTFLRNKGQVQGTWWFNGIGLGVEPTRNGGTLSVSRWNLTYE